ncbi:MAG: hypothetical protein HUU06_10810 [Planctomycetaceae bacterium]|nr:hypothetical protein [Planctomycetaceae bacterium]
MREKSTTTEFRNVLDLLLEGPQDRLRLDGEEYCDFAGLGKVRAPTVLGNIKALAAALAAAVPSAGLSRGLELLLEGGRVSDAGYEAEEDLLREQRWLLALRRARP